MFNNPWSITNFFKFKTLQPHWINTSSNEEIINCLMSNDRILTDFEKFFNGGTVIKEVYELKIPNEEILSFFERRFISEIFGSYYEFSGLERHLINGDYENLVKN